MAATELASVSKLEVRSMTWAPNQARTLEAFHSIKVDDPAFLPVGTVVQYTDPDLGLCFYGTITDVKIAYSPGEGWLYTCADAYRTVIKQPAYIDCSSKGLGKTYKVKFTGGTIAQAATMLYPAVQTFIPGGILNSLPSSSIPFLDKGAQTIDTWLEEILGYTVGGMAYVIPNSGSPALVLLDYTTRPAVTLDIGSYAPITPSSGGNLLLESGNLGATLNRKYGRVIIEGSGNFTRHEAFYIFPEVEAVPPQSAGVFQARFYIPAQYKYILRRYINSQGQCADGFTAKLRIGGNDSGGNTVIGQSSIIVNADDVPLAYDTKRKQYFFWTTIISDAAQADTTLPEAPTVEGWFNFTTYDSPFIAEQVGAGSLAAEGELVEFHPEFYNYTSQSVVINSTAAASNLLAALYARYSNSPDVSGSLLVHIKGLNSNLQPGSSITNFGGMRVRQLIYDFVKRSINLEVSNLPIRDNIQTLKLIAMQKTLPRGGWFTNQGVANTPDCFSDLQISFDGTCILYGIGLNALGGTDTNNPNTPGTSQDDNNSDGIRDPNGHNDKNPPNNNGGGGGPPGRGQTTYDCPPMGPPCVPVQGNGGAWLASDTCGRNCGPNRWMKPPCSKCVSVPNTPDGYATQIECDLDNPTDDPHCGYMCTPQQGCSRVLNGIWSTYALCCAVCDCSRQSGARSGEFSGSGLSGLSGVPSGAGSGADSGIPSGSGVNSTGSGPSFNCGPCKHVSAVVLDAYGRVIDVQCSDDCGSGGSGGVGPSGASGLSGMSGLSGASGQPGPPGSGCASGANGTTSFTVVCGVTCNEDGTITVQYQTITETYVNGCCTSSVAGSCS